MILIFYITSMYLGQTNLWKKVILEAYTESVYIKEQLRQYYILFLKRFDTGAYGFQKKKCWYVMRFVKGEEYFASNVKLWKDNR